MNETILFGSLMIIIIIFGSIGNALVIYSLCKQKKLIKRNNHYYLVLHLAVYDLVCLLFGGEYAYESLSGKNFAFSTLICKLWSTIHTCFFIMDAAVMVIIALIRYRAVFRPLAAPLKRWHINVVLGAGWMLAIACMAPFFWMLHFSPKPESCHPDWPNKTFEVTYTVLLTCIQYFIPVIVLTLVYLRIYKKISENFTETPREDSILAPSDMDENTKKGTWFQKFRNDRNGQIFLVSFAIVICFTISAFPLQLIGIIAISGIPVDRYHTISYLLFVTGVCSLNPFIYKALDRKVFLVIRSFVSKTFRHISHSSKRSAPAGYTHTRNRESSV
ncbi:neuropeptide F receptor-like [Dendronephthya gigantea]|uniref:neuropeptide F receptor-like n=1 Tax=Dendronephthya gigantea TaxID=151771 RepID=UPI00106C9F7F|nr:neuropeptide F receptor-like [Dendronephthya gigantea]